MVNGRKPLASKHSSVPDGHHHLRFTIHYLPVIEMAKNLVIVESPAKAKTINKYLGKDYLVKASIGHIKDLPSKGLGVDVEHNFEPTYELIPDYNKRNNKKIVAELKKVAK